MITCNLKMHLIKDNGQMFTYNGNILIIMIIMPLQIKKK